VLGTAGTAWAAHLGTDVEGHTTLERIISPQGDPAAGYTTLAPEDVNESYVLRDGAAEGDAAIPDAQPGRAQRRRSLTYLSQLTDYQLADEESPARVEFVDGAASSAWRPWEALAPFTVDRSVRQVNRFAPASPVPQGDGSANSMDLALLTGDHADNQQRNETVWVRELLEGNGPTALNSGLTDPGAYGSVNLPDPLCQALVLQEGGAGPAAAEGARYTGVQDYDDYPAGEGPNPAYYDPDDPQGGFADDGWPAYPNLMDVAQTTELTPAGLDVPFYIANGNHDELVQGNEDALAPIEKVATGCAKVLATTADPSDSGLADLLSPANASALMLVPPDEQRRFVSKPQIKSIYGANDPGEEHGFGFVDRDEEENSDGSASYYAWNPSQAPGIRFIALDTNSEGGVVGPFGPLPTGSSNGNLDDPQFEWLHRELDSAQLAGKLVVLFGHHPVRTMNSVIPDEAAAPCSVGDGHGHDVNPGCDLDPRSSEPFHLGDPEIAEELESDELTFAELLGRYPNVLAYVSGHTHENKVLPFDKQGGDVWWEINTSAVADYPQQHRLIEVMDNRDGTLSIFGTLLDHASPATAPAGGDASSFDPAQLASIARTLAFNDPQTGAAATGAAPAGTEKDGNVELLLGDPRSFECQGETATVVGSEGSDKIKGTRGRDVILALGGNDKVKTGRGKDLVCGGSGEDKAKGGGGADRLRGDNGKDKLKGGRGGDRLYGGTGRDRLKGGKGRDRLNGGKARDSCKGGAGRDRTRSC
jgi:3',5'-cyclic AMP phosphodiesterase CpdA